ncbi:MAG: SPFH domain-containing protein [Rhodoferax sp.]|nr:SPFH domain-containing protein [Rhodoferax sp.]
MEKQASNEFLAHTRNGFAAVGMGVGLLLGAVLLVTRAPSLPTLVAAGVLLLTALWFLTGLYALNPNQAALLKLFGSYRGTDRAEGLRWANPFYSRSKVSTRAYNFNSEKLKVNDLRGNPIEIAAAIVWRVEDTARCSFDVEDFASYVLTQAEAAVRHLASSYAYDNLDDAASVAAQEITLRSGGEAVGAALRHELQARFSLAGIVVVDAKLTHLAYAPEIAGAMLRRQQAQAIIAARSLIVQGAVGMVELALSGLQERGLVDLDDERKAAMVTNLLVVLCSDHDAQPVVNTGTLYN